MEWMRFPGEREPNERRKISIGGKMLGDIYLYFCDASRVSQHVLVDILGCTFGVLGILGHLLGSWRKRQMYEEAKSEPIRAPFVTQSWVSLCNA